MLPELRLPLPPPEGNRVTPLDLPRDGAPAHRVVVRDETIGEFAITDGTVGERYLVNWAELESNHRYRFKIQSWDGGKWSDTKPYKRLGRDLLDPRHNRAQELAKEVDYWRRYLASGGLKWPDEFDYRMDPNAEVVDPALREVFAELPGAEISVLDVGAGPATKVGRRFPGKELRVTPVDPLADAYLRLFTEAQIQPPVWTQYGEGERLLEQFGEGVFDVAYARNSIDHVIDPLTVIDNMLAVVRPGGYVVMRHHLNEAVRQNYSQLHQWNFDERGGHLLIWRRLGDEKDLTRVLADRAEVSCRKDQPGWVTGVLRRRDRSKRDAVAEG